MAISVEGFCVVTSISGDLGALHCVVPTARCMESVERLLLGCLPFCLSLLLHVNGGVCFCDSKDAGHVDCVWRRLAPSVTHQMGAQVAWR